MKQINDEFELQKVLKQWYLSDASDEMIQVPISVIYSFRNLERTEQRVKVLESLKGEINQLIDRTNENGK